MFSSKKWRRTYHPLHRIVGKVKRDSTNTEVTNHSWNILTLRASQRGLVLFMTIITSLQK